jgi:hypothetical protein
MMRALITKTLFVLSILLSAQALAFDVGGLSYDIINTTDVEATGRASGNTATNIVIPATVVGSGTTYSVTTIGGQAFSRCFVPIPCNDQAIALTSVIIPDSVTTIGDAAFYKNALTSVIIPDSVTTIGDYAFAGNALTSVIIPDSVTIIGDFAFGGNALTSVTIGNSVTTIEAGAFRENALTSVTIPDSVTTIGNFAFLNNALTRVTIGNSMETIGEQAFYNDALTSAAFLGNFGTFDLNMFQANASLATITYAQGAAGWPQTFTPNTGPTGSVTATPAAAPAPAATPVPTSPVWLLGIMAGLLTLVGMSKLRKA